MSAPSSSGCAWPTAVPQGRAQTRRDLRWPAQAGAGRKGRQAAGRDHPRLPARDRQEHAGPLLTEAVGPLGRRDRAALRTLSGVAPTTKRSGKTCIVFMRHASQVRLRQAALHWARVAVLNAPKCHGRYEAVRVLGVACVLLRRQTLFGPEHGTPVMP